jgi:hypothetical protein
VFGLDMKHRRIQRSEAFRSRTQRLHTRIVCMFRDIINLNLPFTLAAQASGRELESHSSRGYLSAFILCLCCSVCR